MGIQDNQDCTISSANMIIGKELRNMARPVSREIELRTGGDSIKIIRGGSGFALALVRIESARVRFFVAAPNTLQWAVISDSALDEGFIAEVINPENNIAVRDRPVSVERVEPFYVGKYRVGTLRTEVSGRVLSALVLSVSAPQPFMFGPESREYLAKIAAEINGIELMSSSHLSTRVLPGRPGSRLFIP